MWNEKLSQKREREHIVNSVGINICGSNDGPKPHSRWDVHTEHIARENKNSFTSFVYIKEICNAGNFKSSLLLYFNRFEDQNSGAGKVYPENNWKLNAWN